MFVSLQGLEVELGKCGSRTAVRTRQSSDVRYRNDLVSSFMFAETEL